MMYAVWDEDDIIQIIGDLEVDYSTVGNETTTRVFSNDDVVVQGILPSNPTVKDVVDFLDEEGFTVQSGFVDTDKGVALNVEAK